MPFTHGQGTYTSAGSTFLHWVNVPHGEQLEEGFSDASAYQMQAQLSHQTWWPVVLLEFHPEWITATYIAQGVCWVVCVYQLCQLPYVAWPIMVAHWAA